VPSHASRDVVVVCVERGGQLPAWSREDRGYDVVVVPGTGKWPLLARLLAEEPELADGEGSVWFPDADVDATPETVEAMFALHAELGTALSHPSLDPTGAHRSAVTLQHRGFSVRLTSLVETTAPLFSRAGLRLCVATFGSSTDGAGLPQAWQSLLAGADLTSAVLDCVPVRCSGASRPRPPRHAGTALAVEHGVAVPGAPAVLGGLDAAFRPLDRAAAVRLTATHLGLGPRPPAPAPAVDGLDPDGSAAEAYASAVWVDLALCDLDLWSSR